VFRQHGIDADRIHRNGKFDVRNWQFDGRRIFGDRSDIRNVGSDAAVRWRWRRWNCIGHLRERNNRLVQSNNIGLVAKRQLAIDGRPRRNSDGIFRACNGRLESFAEYYDAEPVHRRANRDQHCPVSD
jgi:hypothetical protein